jgi:hypothetical protein
MKIMKKILYVLTIALGTCFAANAQTSKQSEEATTTNVQVTSGGQTMSHEATVTTEESGTAKKSCCSAKEGATAGKGKKACCAEGSKSDAHCTDKKSKADAGTTKDHE